ncbi:Adaptive-response sensory-kinase SasA [Sinobacterium norvegicum]|uniref:histidine kinase n=1 Tax=Sinobacterium norvegicum TaxID=1641715 RepID=A0ABN8ELE2_9GAMM|nr:ATP-binding protein [Sinobacterium norvegicum]CAH0993213.1 Adaptive-response sensory-kinase SasA [Sinobacterium norvegicum]
MLASSSERLFFRNYTFYRIFICLCLLTLFLLNLHPRLIGNENPDLFATVIIIYGAVCLINLLLFSFDIPGEQFKVLLFCCFLVDILAITLLSYSSGSAGNGLSLLLVIIVVIGSISMGASISTLLAAIATIAVLIRNSLLYVDEGNNHLLLTGAMQGVIFFFTSIIVQRFSHKLSQTEKLASVHATSLAELQHLNQLIVQRMQTGVIVATDQHNMKLVNEAANRLLGGKLDQSHMLPEVLQQKFDTWLNDRRQYQSTFEAYQSGPNIRVSFAPLNSHDHQETLIFLEDSRLLTQQAQQIKLSSLGRLTASIAHEIRNPLGAISHAAQLLNESEVLTGADKKLTNIIENHSLRINQIIENVLSLSRRQKAEPQTILLRDFLKEFRSNFLTSQPHAILEIQLNKLSDHTVTFDPGQLMQVLTNLCENAIRYSQAVTGEPKVTIRSYTDANNKLPQLDIIDYGHGVKDSMLGQIFEPFFTTENTGSGLGLYLCREMCEANHSLLHYQPDQHQRSCFKLTLSHPKKRWQPSN